MASAVRPPSNRNQRGDKARFVASMHAGEAIPERDDAQPLCIYCCTDSQTDRHAPYCSDLCAVMAQVG